MKSFLPVMWDIFSITVTIVALIGYLTYPQNYSPAATLGTFLYGLFLCIGMRVVLRLSFRDLTDIVFIDELGSSIVAINHNKETRTPVGDVVDVEETRKWMLPHAISVRYESEGESLNVIEFVPLIDATWEPPDPHPTCLELRKLCGLRIPAVPELPESGYYG